jgi:hypothetical protein
MDLRLVGEWDGTPEKYDRFSEKLLEPVLQGRYVGCALQPSSS